MIQFFNNDHNEVLIFDKNQEQKVPSKPNQYTTSENSSKSP